MSFYMLNPKEMEKIRCEENALIVDVRERKKFVQFHYKNAINIPYIEDERWLNWFCAKQVYILYCEYGNISLLAARKLSKRGVKVYTVIGGMNAVRDILR